MGEGLAPPRRGRGEDGRGNALNHARPEGWWDSACFAYPREPTAHPCPGELSGECETQTYSGTKRRATVNWETPAGFVEASWRHLEAQLTRFQGPWRRPWGGIRVFWCCCVFCLGPVGAALERVDRQRRGQLRRLSGARARISEYYLGRSWGAPGLFASLSDASRARPKVIFGSVGVALKLREQIRKRESEQAHISETP